MTNECFKSPAPLFYGTDFWMLNGALSDEEIERQLTEMKDKGVRAVIARTYLGLRSDYPGKSFMGHMKKIVATAKALGIKLFLQAGYMPEAVPDLPSDHALRYIYPVRTGEEAGRRILCQKNGISFVEHNSETFLDMFDETAMAHYLKVCYEDMWAEFSDEYGKTVLSIWVDEPSYSGSYLPWTSTLAARFEERYGYTLPDKVWMLYYDGEGAETLRYHYRTLMRDLLQTNYFERVREWCNAHGLLFSGHLMMEETTESQIRRAQACMPYYRYFDIPGIDVLRARMPFASDPVTDPDPTERQFNLYTTALQCTSAARQAGKKHVLAEMYGVSGEGFSFRHMVSMFDSYAAMGINHRSVHGIFYTLHGRGKRAYPPHVGYYQPYWPKYKHITDYCARVSAFITEGESSADIAVIHPLETGYMLYRGAAEEGGLGGGKEIGRLDGAFYELIKALKSAGLQIDLADLASIRDMGSAEGGCLTVGLAKYKTVILPSLQVITSDALCLLEKMAADGGRILCLGDAPTYLDGYESEDAKKRLEAISQKAESTAALLSLLPSPAVSIRGAGAQNLLINRRICENGEKLFIYNTDCQRAASAFLTAPASGALYRYDAFTASIEAYPHSACGGRLTAELSLAPGSSILLSFEKEIRKDAATAAAADAPRLCLPLLGAWEARAEEDNVLLLEYCSYKKDTGEFSKPLPITAIQRLLSAEGYNGPLVLRYALQTENTLSDVLLALEDPLDQKIFLDGKRIESKASGYFHEKTFECVKLGTLTEGLHTLEIQRHFQPLSRVTNALTQLFETRYGVELEPMYLLGRFAVKGHATASQNGAITLENGFSLISAPQTFDSLGEITAEGYPFYVGKIQLKKRFSVPCGQNTASAYFSLGVLNAACAEVFVNGVPVGDICRAPASLPIGKALTEGENEITLRLYTTLFNIIGPFHRPLGNVGNTFGGGYKNPDAAWLSVNTDIPDWQMHMEDFYPTWTDRYNLTPLGIAEAALLFPEEKTRAHD